MDMLFIATVVPMVIGMSLLLTIDRWTAWKIFNPKMRQANPKRFDFIFGILAPMLCLIFDPIVFRNTFGRGDPCDYDAIPLLFPEIAIFAYMAIGLGITFLAIWLFNNPWAKRTSLIFAGVLFAGAGFSYRLGIVLLPDSLLGICYVGIGVFGFIPFLTGSVFARHGAQAWRQAVEESSAWQKLGRGFIAAIIMLVLFGFSAYVQWQIAPIVPQPAVVCPEYPTS